MPPSVVGVLVAAVQLTSGADKLANRAAAEALVREAATAGAVLVVLPELVDCLGSSAELRASAEPLDGPFARWAEALAHELGIWLHAGSFVELHRDGDRTNTSIVVAPDGGLAGVYRKVHLFDCDVPGAEFHESETFTPGREVVAVDLGRFGPGATDDVVLGCATCYDLRFPELFRELADDGARILALPAAFTATTGAAHWDVLVRARAIENQAFVIAAGQTGSSGERLRWHGHSMVVDPWGTVLAERAAGPGLVLADLDLDRQDEVRRILPALDHRRL